MTEARHRARGAALVYALVIIAVLTLTGAGIVATRIRSAQDTRAVTERTRERATTEAAAEHGKALVQQAIGAQVALEQLAELEVVTGDVNGLEYRIDLSLAPYGDVRADLTGNDQWASARLDPLTGEPLKHLTSNANIEALALQGEWRDALVHEPPEGDPLIIGIHKDGVFERDLDAPIPVLVPFPALNAPPARVTARGSGGAARDELGVLLDAHGNVWEWGLRGSSAPRALPGVTNVTTVTAGDTFAVAVTGTGELMAWGENARGPLRPNGAAGETLDAPARLDLRDPEGEPVAVLAAAAGDHHVIALDARGTVHAWGANDRLQLGRSCGGACAAGVVPLEGASRIVSVAAGGDRSAAMDNTGRLWVWGAGAPPAPLTDQAGEPLRVTHYSLSSTEGLAVTRDARLVRFTSAVARPHELRVTTNEQAARGVTVARADLLAAGETYHAAIVGSALVTWPAGHDAGAAPAARQSTPGERPPLEHDDLPNVTVTPGNASLTIAWAAPSETVNAYQVQLAADAKTWQHAAHTTDAGVHVTGLTNGQPYYLRILALDEYGDAVREHLSGPYTPAGPPGAPANGRVTPLHQALELAWDAPPNNGAPITHYVIEQSTNGVIWRTLPHQPTQPQVRITGLENDTTYHHRVHAVNAAGRSEALDLPAAAPHGPPAPPTIERADGHTMNGAGAITVTWESAPGATGYRAYHSANGRDWTATTAPAGATSVTITGLQYGVTYSVYLVATNQHGDSRPSARVNATPRDAPPPPTGLTAEAQNATTAIITWEAPVDANVTGYRLERKDPRDGVWTLIATPTGTNHLDTGLQRGWVFSYRVAAVAGTTTGAYSGAAEVLTGIGAPGAPERLRVLERTLDSVTLAWDPPKHLGGVSAATITYRVDRRLEGEDTWSTIEQGISSLTLTDKAAQRGQQYVYRVVARNSAGNGPESNIIAVTAPDYLTTPDRPRLAARGHLSVTIEWDANPDPAVTGYIVERAEAGKPYARHAEARAEASDTIAYTDTRVTAGATYTYRVRARSADGETNAGQPSENIKALARPAAPANVTAETDPRTGRIDVTWSAPTDLGGGQAAGYAIQRSVNGGDWTTLATTTSPATTHTDDTGVVGAQHSYRVAVITELGEALASPYSPPSDPVTLTRAPDAPAAPVVAPAPTDPTRPIVTWQAPFDGGAPITHYELERSDAAGWRAIATVAAATTYHVDASAEPGATYRYRVTAVNAAGASEPSPASDWHQTHPTATAPGAPTVNIAGTARLHVAWTAATGEVTGYRVDRRQDDGAWATIVANTASTATAYTDTNLTVGAAYAYRVAALNAIGVAGEPSPASDPVTAASPPDAPEPPTAARAGANAQVQWWAPRDGHAPITAYRLERRDRPTDGDAWNAWTQAATTTDTTHLDTTLEPGRAYQYRVTATNAAGDSAPSQPSATITTEPPTAETPTPPRVTLQPTTNGELLTAWDDIPGALTYEVETSTDEDFRANVKQHSTQQPELLLPPPPAGVTLHVRVRARNVHGWSGWSEAITYTRAATSAPTTPTATAANGSVTVQWSPVPGAQLYALKRQASVDGHTWGATTDTARGEATQYVDVAVAPGFHYRYAVAAIIDGAETAPSAWSAPVTATD